MTRHKRIAILTGGGDCPGINAVIRAVAKKAILEQGLEVVGIEDGYEGLIHDRTRKLHYDDVSGILTQGGTILGASKTSNPYRYAVKTGKGLTFRDVSRRALRTIRGLEVDALVCIGGDGTLGIAHRLMEDGVPVVGVPKTIDNDLRGTDVTFGFDTAVADRHRGHRPAPHDGPVPPPHHDRRGHGPPGRLDRPPLGSRGRRRHHPHSGDSLRPRRDRRQGRGEKRRGRRFSIVVIAEGAKPKGGDVVVKRIVEKSSDPVRLGGIGFVVQEQLEKATGIETRTVVLGHLQRGGSPTAVDRVLATQLGSKAVDLIVAQEMGLDGGDQGVRRHRRSPGGRRRRAEDRAPRPRPDRVGPIDRHELRRPTAQRRFILSRRASKRGSSWSGSSSGSTFTPTNSVSRSR